MARLKNKNLAGQNLMFVVARNWSTELLASFESAANITMA